MKISGVVIAKNAEAIIEDCLSSLKFCDEIIVVDNGSTDRTIEIARRNEAKIVSEKSDDFSGIRNTGLDKASADWVLYVDSDERVTDDLAKEILAKLKSPGEYAAFRLKRKNYYLGGFEWPYVERLERLFKKYGDEKINQMTIINSSGQILKKGVGILSCIFDFCILNFAFLLLFP